MESWHNDKSKVKDVFDSIRNYGICGLIFYAGMYQLSGSGGSRLEILDIFSGLSLVVISFYLYYINTKIMNRLFREWAPKGLLRSVLFLVFPSAITGLVGFFLLTHSAVGIKSEPGIHVESKKSSEPRGEINSGSSDLGDKKVGS